MREGEKNKTKKKDKILILASTFGEGHQQVAYAVREAVQSRTSCCGFYGSGSFLFLSH